MEPGLDPFELQNFRNNLQDSGKEGSVSSELGCGRFSKNNSPWVSFISFDALVPSSSDSNYKRSSLQGTQLGRQTAYPLHWEPLPLGFLSSRPIGTPSKDTPTEPKERHDKTMMQGAYPKTRKSQEAQSAQAIKSQLGRKALLGQNKAIKAKCL